MSNLPDNLKEYRYLISSFQFLFPDKPDIVDILPNQVTTFSIEKNYDTEHFPVLKVTMQISTMLYYRILAKKTETKVRMRLQKYVTKVVPQFKEDVFNDLFVFFLPKDEPFIDKKLHEAAKKTDGSNTTSRDMNTELTLYLFKESDLVGSKAYIGNILTCHTMTDTLAYLLSSGGFGKVLMTPLDNQSAYNEIRLLGLPLLGQIIYLDNQYGFYNLPLLLFFDIDTTYILDKNPNCTAWRPNEIKQTVFSVKDSLNPNSLTSGGIIKDNKYIINITPGSEDISNESVVLDHIEGNNFISVNTSTCGKNSVSSGAVQRGPGTYRLFFNKYYNSFAESNKKAEIKENGDVVNTNTSNIDISAFAPNKEYLFIYEDQELNSEYGGKYRITNTVFVFAKSGEEYKVTCNSQFKKYDR